MIETIINIVADVYGVDANQIVGKSRKAPLPEARSTAIYFSKVLKHPNKHIASAFAIDENYIHRACRKTKNEMEIYADVAQIMERIQLELNPIITKNTNQNE